MNMAKKDVTRVRFLSNGQENIVLAVERHFVQDPEIRRIRQN